MQPQRLYKQAEIFEGERKKKKNHTLWESTLNKAQNFNCEKQKLQEILRK